VVDEIKQAARQTPRVEVVTEVRVRWLGHRLHAELNLAVDPTLSVAEGHEIAVAGEQQLLAKLRFLSHATIHVDPVDESGAAHHHLAGQAHVEAAAHSH
jgi:divalent metal cation (Fe/Co/Zn/Cd) transporter